MSFDKIDSLIFHKIIIALFVKKNPPVPVGGAGVAPYQPAQGGVGRGWKSNNQK